MYPGKKRIGLLGGSFNPAHQGHRHISLMALSRLRLDYVWWLVSPQNPLKEEKDMAPFARRMVYARKLARHPQLRVSALEQSLGTRHTADTLAALVRRFPSAEFVWLMGADNLEQIDQWRDWENIFATVPIAVFGRPSYSLRALSSKAARRYRRYRMHPRQARLLPGHARPAWIFFEDRPHPGSATRLRAKKKKL